MEKVFTRFNSAIINLILEMLELVTLIINYSIRKGLTITFKALQKAIKAQ